MYRKRRSPANRCGGPKLKMVKSEPNLASPEADGDKSQNLCPRVCASMQNPKLSITTENDKYRTASKEARSHPLLLRGNQPDTERSDTFSKFDTEQESEDIDARAHPLLLLSASKPKPNFRPSTNTTSSGMEEHTHPLLLLSSGSSKLNHKNQLGVKTNLEISSGPSGIQKGHPLMFLPRKHDSKPNSSSNAKSHPLLHRAPQLPKASSSARNYQPSLPKSATSHTAPKTDSATEINEARSRLRMMGV